MKSTNHNKINEELVVFFNKEKTFVLAKNLEDENYALSFNRSNNLYLLRPLGIYRTELLSSDYFHRLYVGII